MLATVNKRKATAMNRYGPGTNRGYKFIGPSVASWRTGYPLEHRA
jgi:hypothetical protein